MIFIDKVQAIDQTRLTHALPAPEQGEVSGHVSKDKRRVQVRKAQVAHRQRKAKYVEQLEADIAGIRDKISNADSARQMLRDENDAIRSQLSAAASAAASAYNQATAPAVELSCMSPYLHDHFQYQDPNLDPTLGMDQFGAMDGAVHTLPPFYTSESSPFASSVVGSSLGGGSPHFPARSGSSSPYTYLQGV